MAEAELRQTKRYGASRKRTQQAMAMAERGNAYIQNARVRRNRGAENLRKAAVRTTQAYMAAKIYR
jgi:hypothetical protein